LRWLLTVLTVMALLTAGWPLVNALVTDNQRLAPGASLRVGPSGPNSATVRAGPGWIERPAETDPRHGYMLRRGAVAISIEYVSLAGHYRSAEVWAGLRRVLRLSNPGVSLGRPAAVTSRQGRAGLSATATGARRTGAATVFVGPSGAYAIQMVVLAPLNWKPVATAISLLLIGSLRFPVVRHSLAASR
jgi:hypothetical protein